MITSLSSEALLEYVKKQLNFFFPDNISDTNSLSKQLIDIALSKIEYCFQKVTLPYYFDGKDVRFNHLFSDHYVMFIWYLSNSVYKEFGKCSLANKLYYLNKTYSLVGMFVSWLPHVLITLYFGQDGQIDHL